MARAQFAPVLDYVRRLLGSPPGDDGGDGPLLERFTRDRDQAAFVALMARHGPAVLGVCQRVLRDAHLAEDAFQATFLVLARKAGSVRQGGALGSWLCRIAYHVAVTTHAQQVRRQVREQARATAMTGQPSADDRANQELREVFDEELNRLPDRFHAPVVLCYLEGKSHEEAARELGWPAGTVKSRLSRARDRLRERLSRRGLTLENSGSALWLGQAAAPAAVPKTLLDATALLVFSSAPLTGPVAAVVEGVLSHMFLHKLKTAAFVVLLLVALAGAPTAFWLFPAQGSPPTGTAAVASAVDVAAPAAAADGPVPERRPAQTLGSSSWLHGKGSAHRAALSADGKTLITSPLDWSKGIVWDATTGRQVREFGGDLPQHGGLGAYIGDLALSLDGKSIALWDARYQVIYVEDAATGKDRQALDTFLRKGDFSSGSHGSLAFAPDGKSLALSLGDKICVWELASRKVVHQLAMPKTAKPLGQVSANQLDQEHIGQLAYSLDGMSLAIQSLNHRRYDYPCKLTVWKLGENQPASEFQIKYRPGYTPHYTVFSPDARLVATQWNDGSIAVHEMATGQELRRLKYPMPGIRPCYAWSPDGKLLAAPGRDNRIHLLSTETGKAVRELALAQPQPGPPANRERPVHDFLSVVFSPDGKTLIAPGQRFVHLWDVESGKEIVRAQGHQGPITHLAFSADGTTLTSGSYHPRPPYDSSGRFPWDKTVRIWDLKTQQQTRQTTLTQFEPKDGLVPWLQPLGNGTTLALHQKQDNQVILWDVALGKQTSSLKIEPTDVSPAAVSPDGKWLALIKLGGGATVVDETITCFVHLWDVAAGKEVRQLRCTRPYPKPRAAGALEPIGDRPPPRYPPDFVAFAPDGLTLAAVVYGGGLYVWDTVTGAELTQLPQFKGSYDGIYGLSRDGRTLSNTSGGSKAVTYWETLTGSPRGVVMLKHPESYQACLAFSPDGRLAASSGRTGNSANYTEKGTIHLIDTATNQELARFVGHVGQVHSLAFSPDGKTLASGGSDSAIHLWDLANLAPAPAAVQNLGDQELAGLWEALADSDGKKAYQASRRLVLGKQTATFLRGRLQAVKPVDPQRLARLLADLDSNQFATRQKASEELEQLAQLAQAALQKVLAGKPALDTQQRVEALLARLKDPALSPERRQAIRGVEVLEELGSAEARQVLETVAQGAPEVRLTREAQRALDRLRRGSAGGR